MTEKMTNGSSVHSLLHADNLFRHMMPIFMTLYSEHQLLRVVVALLLVYLPLAETQVALTQIQADHIDEDVIIARRNMTNGSKNVMRLGDFALY